MRKKSKKYDWEQSKFVPNCPIYYVRPDGGSILMRIEYDVTNAVDDWKVEVLNGFASARIDGTIHESYRIKREAEKLLQKTIKEISK